MCERYNKRANGDSLVYKYNNYNRGPDRPLIGWVEISDQALVIEAMQKQIMVRPIPCDCALLSRLETFNAATARGTSG